MICGLLGIMFGIIFYVALNKSENLVDYLQTLQNGQLESLLFKT